MPRLVLHAGTQQARGFELKPGSNYVGRGFSNDLQIEDPSVSSNHARIQLEGEVITVKDLGSTNGTFIDRSQVREGFMQPGQLLHLGGVELLLQGDTANVTIAPPAPPSAVPSAPAPVNGARYSVAGVNRSAAAPVASPPRPPPVPAGRAAPSRPAAISRPGKSAEVSNNMLLGIVGALIGAGLGAGLMYGFFLMTGFKFPLLGTGIGLLTGLGARMLYRGTDTSLGVLAAGISLVTSAGALYLMFGDAAILGFVSVIVSGFVAYRIAS